MIRFIEVRKHASVRQLLSAHIDGRASLREARRIEEHLSGCEECRREADSLQATVRLLHALPALKVPRSFTLTVAPARLKPVPRAAWGAAIATSVASLLVVALLVGDLLGAFTQASGGEYQAAAIETIAAPEAAFAPAPVPPEARIGGEEATRPVEQGAEISAAAAEMSAEVSRAADAPTAPETLAAPAAPQEQLAPSSPVPDKGIQMPLWQLEAGTGALFLLLVLATTLILRRRRRGA